MQKLKQIISDKNYSIKGFAESIGMSATTLLHLIDAGNPTLRSIVKIANGLGMKPWELMRFVSTDYKSEISRTVTHVDNIKIITIVEKETSDEN